MDMETHIFIPVPTSPNRGDGNVTGSQKKVEMIGYQRPGVTKRFTVADNPGQALDEIIAIIVIEKKLSPFYPPADDMVQGAGRIDSCFSWHFDYISSAEWIS
jgi:hypothetical protein